MTSHGAAPRRTVSRETSTPPPPPAAVEAFGSALPLARRYAGWLAGPGVVRGLLGPREVPRLWDRHLVDCAGLAPVADRALAAHPPAGVPQVIDLGSGAGLPGVVLALLRPDWRITLLEPLLRRATFLTEVVEDLGLAGVSVVRARAEELARSQPGGADLVVARAVAPLERLAGWALPLTAPGGSLLALKGRSAAEELQAAAAALRAAGAQDSEVVAVPDSPSRVVRVVAGATPRPARAAAKPKAARAATRTAGRPATGTATPSPATPAPRSRSGKAAAAQPKASTPKPTPKPTRRTTPKPAAKGTARTAGRAARPTGTRSTGRRAAGGPS